MEESEEYEINVHWYVDRWGRGSWEYAAWAGTRQVGYGHEPFRWLGLVGAWIAIAEHRANRRRASKSIRKTITRKKA